MSEFDSAVENQVFSSQVYRGDQLGRTIGFPTLNLDSSILPSTCKQGVYAAEVWYNEQRFAGALYFGPRKVLDEEHTVLEMYLLNFSQEIYGQEVQFRLHTFLRPVLDFASFSELQEQLQADVLAVKEVLTFD